MVIVDTSVWIQAFRPRPFPESTEVDNLLAEGRVAMTGPVLTELLQGTSDREEYETLMVRLTSLPYLEATLGTWASGGLLAFQLRRQGKIVCAIDLVIAALALQNDVEIYSLDHHFERIPRLKHYIPTAGNGQG